MSNWDSSTIPALDGKVIIVTGANSGLGFGSTKELAHKGATVIMAVRNTDKGEQAAKEIKAEVPNAQLDVMALDLGDLESVEAFAGNFTQRYARLDVLMNNAGIMQPAERMTTQQGFEVQFGVNHIGHFALTGHLLETLNQTPDARIVTVSSIYANVAKGKIYWDDLQFEKNYDREAAYAQSKLANQMFTIELNERLKASGASTISVAAHPGYTATGLQRHMGLLVSMMNVVVAQNLEMGVLGQLRAAIDPNVGGGEYYGPTKLGGMRGYPQAVNMNPITHDAAEREKFWALSEELSGVTYEFEGTHEPYLSY